MQHLSEVLRMIENGMRHNPQGVQDYAQLLADKLEGEGEGRQARAVRRSLESSPASVGGAALQTAPVDEDSKLNTLDRWVPAEQPDTLILPRIVVERLEDFVSGIREHDLWAAQGLAAPNRLLLVGPPGTGKTSLARQIAWDLQLPLLTTRSDTLVSSLLGSTSKNIHRVFEYARSQPCVLFLDEFDALAKDRADAREVGELQRIALALVQNLDAFPASCVLVAATNHPQLLDPAIWRRFEVTIRIPLPNNRARGELWRSRLGRFAPGPKQIDALVDASEGLSPATIERTALDAMRLAISQSIPTVSAAFVMRRLARATWVDRYDVFEDPPQEMRALRDWAPSVFSMRSLAGLFNVSTRQVSNALGSDDEPESHHLGTLAGE